DASRSRTLNLKTSFSDGEPHTVSLYFLDYQSGERVLSMNVLDTATGAVLDKQTLSAFDDGAYLTWRVKGNVTFQVKSKLSTPVVSGIFVDAGLTYQAWLTNYFPTLLT